MPREDRIVLKNIVQDSTAVIVHETFQKEILKEAFGDTGNVRVIPHGIRDIKPVKDARKLIGAEGMKTALLVGYYRPSKRFERILRFWPRVVERCPDALLVLAGKMRNIAFSDYYHELMKEVDASPVKGNILVLRGLFPPHTFDAIVSSADCMLLPYEAGAQSGILCNAAAFHVPVITSDLKSFDEWNRLSGGGLSASSDDEYVDQICRVLQDKSLRSSLKKSIQKFIPPMYWENVARSHREIYEGVVRSPVVSSRYFYVPEG
jgi:glycosyltransferase involved in cell wall biosynthesis